MLPEFFIHINIHETAFFKSSIVETCVNERSSIVNYVGVDDWGAELKVNALSNWRFIEKSKPIDTARLMKKKLRIQKQAQSSFFTISCQWIHWIWWQINCSEKDLIEASVQLKVIMLPIMLRSQVW